MSWQSIVPEKDVSVYIKLIRDIQHTIDSKLHQREFSSPDVMYGQSGIAIFFMYISQYEEFYKKDNEKILDAVETSLHQLTSIPDLNLSLGEGVTGVVWMMQHLVKHGIIDADLKDMFEDILKELENFSYTLLSKGNYDYLSGGLGCLLIALEGYNDIDIVSKLQKLLNSAINIEQNKTAWKYYDRSIKAVREIFNLGISHGNPAIVLILGLFIVQCPHLKPLLSPYISNALNWIASTKNAPGAHSSFSGYTMGIPNTDYTPLRWCYGDMGIAFTFYLSGKRLQDKALENEGIDIMLNCVRRLESEIDEIEDAHICHGTAGVGHMFNRFFQYTNIIAFKEAALMCFGKTIEKAVRTDDEYVFFYSSKGEYGNVPFGGLIEGSAGIALTLLAAISDIEPKWDRLFLLS